MKIITNFNLFFNLFFILNLSYNVDCFVGQQNGKFIDTTNNNELYFHGVNVVYKGPPWYPTLDKFNINTSFVKKDYKILENLGFNSVRLGIMWPGVEPYEGFIDNDYLDILYNITLELNKHNIYVILDFHQDIISSLFCGEGVPNWFVFKYLDNKTINNFPIPIDKPYNILNNKVFNNSVFNNYNNYNISDLCDKNNWIKYHFSYAVSETFQKLYDNPESMKNYWYAVSNKFKDCINCIGYEIINEPWCGNIFKNPLLLTPYYAENINLLPFYNKIISYIREYDKNHIIFFETVTWNIFKIGFNNLPYDIMNNIGLSYHIYTPPNISPILAFEYRIQDLNKYNIVGYLTEFDYGSGNFKTSNKKEMNNLINLLNNTDKYLQSWAVWEYKSFYNLTGANSGFFNNTNKLYNNGVMYLSRPYPIQIGGTLLYFHYNINNSKIYITYNIFNNLYNSNSIIYLGAKKYNKLNIKSNNNCSNYNINIKNNRLFLNVINIKKIKKNYYYNYYNLICKFIIEV